jgi:hypothetical protein
MSADRKRVDRIVADHRPTTRTAQSPAAPTGKAPRSGAPILRVEIAIPIAKVLLKRPFRDDNYVRNHVAAVVKMRPAHGEWHIRANLQMIREKLEAMGLDRATVHVEMRDTEARIRAELWRQIILREPSR